MDPTARVPVAEDLSDSSQSSSHLHAFQDYDKIKELNLSMLKPKDSPASAAKDFSFPLDKSRQQLIPLDDRIRDRPRVLEKPKETSFPVDRSKDFAPYLPSRPSDADFSASQSKVSKDVVFGFDARAKNFRIPAESGKESFAGDRDMKDFEAQKNSYGLPLGRMKEFGLSLDRIREGRIGNLALERLRGNAILENPGILEGSGFRGGGALQSRTELEAIAIERMRSRILSTDLANQNMAGQLPITQMQQTQQQNQQQAKSFTIDAILGLRNNQREKQQRGHPHQFRKHQGHEGSAKNCSSGSSSSSSGKLKRVRTIFTAEQLERLEGEFARQQYMVGPERLYLAHALRLTEAQVKVWFQNRRIKWRKLHHEQQRQSLHELHQRSLSSLEPEDSNETGDWCN